MNQNFVGFVVAVCILLAVFVWTSANSTPQNSFDGLVQAVKQTNSGEFDRLVDQEEIAMSAAHDIVPDAMIKQTGRSGLSFADYRTLLGKTIASQISGLGRVQTPENAEGGYKFLRDEGRAPPAEQIVKNYLSKHPDSALARVLLDSGRSGDHLSALLTKYGITAENFRGAAPLKEYDRKGMVLTGRCCSTELKFVNPQTQKETVVNVEFEREHGLFGDRGNSMPPLFKPDHWVLRRVLNLPAVISANEPDFFPYMQANAASAYVPGVNAPANMEPLLTPETKAKGKKLWNKFKEWAKD